jgi:hypothetical protein
MKNEDLYHEMNELEYQIRREEYDYNPLLT